MDNEYYLKKFQKSTYRINKKILDKKQLKVHVGEKLNSIILKLYKTEWTNDYDDPINAETRIFFSIWVTIKPIQENKVFYNIHAFKLRKLKGYAIKSREFADRFREDFKPSKQNWKNVSVEFGPLTLMEGWEQFNDKNLEDIVVLLANNFLSIDHLIDNNLQKFEKRKLS